MIIHANSFRLGLADRSVHCAITSPPYWGLRDYGLKPLVFGGESGCAHEWETSTQDVQNNNGLQGSTLTSGAGLAKRQEWHDGKSGKVTTAFCRLCNAWRGSYGLEPTIDLYVQHTVEVCREVKRVLRDDGVFWLNCGDSYVSKPQSDNFADPKVPRRTPGDRCRSVELPPKSLCLIPQRVALALQADGWILRSAPPWVKRNPMPESVTDRPGTAHESVFMFVKRGKYYWDAEGVRRGLVPKTPKRYEYHYGGEKAKYLTDSGQRNDGYNQGRNLVGRSLRTSDFFFDSLDAEIAHLQYIRDNGGLLLDGDGHPAAFVVNPKGYSGCHYATFPTALVEPMVKAATSERGVCPVCGAGWVRVVEKELTGTIEDRPNNGMPGRTGKGFTKLRAGDSQTQTLGFRPGCACPPAPAIPAVVLDPFAGSGTVGQVCRELGRRFIGADLNPKYLAENALPRAERKTSAAALATLPMFAEAEVE